MFWKNAKTLKYEYIQRERDVVSVPAPFGKSALAYTTITATTAIYLYVYVFIAMMGLQLISPLYFLSFPLLYRTQNGTLRGLFKLMLGVGTCLVFPLRLG